MRGRPEPGREGSQGRRGGGRKHGIDLKLEVAAEEGVWRKTLDEVHAEAVGEDEDEMLGFADQATDASDAGFGLECGRSGAGKKGASEVDGVRPGGVRPDEGAGLEERQQLLHTGGRHQRSVIEAAGRVKPGSRRPTCRERVGISR